MRYSTCAPAAVGGVTGPRAVGRAASEKHGPWESMDIDPGALFFRMLRFAVALPARLPHQSLVPACPSLQKKIALPVSPDPSHEPGKFHECRKIDVRFTGPFFRHRPKHTHRDPAPLATMSPTPRPTRQPQIHCSCFILRRYRRCCGDVGRYGGRCSRLTQWSLTLSCEVLCRASGR